MNYEMKHNTKCTRVTADKDHKITEMINNRVYVDAIDINMTKQTNQHLRYLTDLTYLRIQTVRNEPVDDELDLSHLTNLKCLELVLVHNDGGFNITYPKSELEELNIMSYKGFLDLSSLTHLSYLKLYGTYQTKDKDIDLTNMTNLKSLHVYSCDNTFKLSSDSNIEYLECSGNSLIQINKLVHLKILDICTSPKKRFFDFSHNKELKQIKVGKVIYPVSDINRSQIVIQKN